MNGVLDKVDFDKSGGMLKHAQHMNVIVAECYFHTELNRSLNCHHVRPRNLDSDKEG